MSRMLYEGSQRFCTRAEGRITRHSFSFGEHYDPANLGFGPMVCHNDDALVPGSGYGVHPHSNLEIVTWVLSGSLVGTQPDGRHRLLRPGQVQVLSAGSGIRHSEVGDPTSGPTRFIQVWLRPDEADTVPTVHDTDLGDAVGQLVEVVGGDGLRIGTAGASLSVARLLTGQHVRLPAAAHQHVYAATGALLLDGVPLRAGDAVRAVDAGGVEALALAETELLVWSFR